MDAARLLADGSPVTLADGSTVHVRFDFEAMMRVEAAFGSAVAFAKELDARANGKGFAAVLAGLQAAVRDRQITPADLQPGDVYAYRDALVAAWIEAMPDAEGKATGRTEDGTGRGSTTSPPSGSADERMSGAA